MRKEKGRELKRNMRNGGKKKFNRLGGHRIEKRKNLEAMSCQQKSHRARKKKKKLKKKVPNHQCGFATRSSGVRMLKLEFVLEKERKLSIRKRLVFV
jgi:hypothetical protein